MNIQIFGRKKGSDTKKAERFFKERSIKFQFVNLDEKELSNGEFNSIKSAVGGAENMIDKDCKEFKKKNLEYIVYDAETELREDQKLLSTPIIRDGKKAIIGFDVNILKDWIE